MDQEYYYYIIKKPEVTQEKNSSGSPMIFKIKVGRLSFELTDKNEAEGPFSSLYELKRRSFIFNSIQKQKIKIRISNYSNIKELKDFIPTKMGTTFTGNFINSFAHTTAGKFSKEEVSGIHFYDPDRVRIIEILLFDKNSGVYEAVIEVLNLETGQWVKKEGKSSFFPDSWSITRLFHEC